MFLALIFFKFDLKPVERIDQTICDINAKRSGKCGIIKIANLRTSDDLILISQELKQQNLGLHEKRSKGSVNMKIV